MIGSAGLRYISEVEAQDATGNKKKICVGSNVDFPPVTLKEPTIGDILLSRQLGKGPFPIGRIGRWPCGRIMLY